MDTVQEGESGTNGESSINIYIPSCIKWIAGEKLLYNMQPHLALCDDLRGWDSGDGREAQEGYMYKYG